MTKSIISVSLYLRTAFFIDSLRARTGLGYTKLDKIVRDNQYEAYGLRAPSHDTVKDYFRHKRSPSVDNKALDTQPWLIACELEFPGSSYNFFHPLFDLLLGQIESSIKNREKAQLIPVEWIKKIIEIGNFSLADEWKRHNETVKKNRGRPKKTLVDDKLRFIHLNLMRLAEPVFSVLFIRTGIAITYARRYQPIEVEIKLLIESKSMESIAALVGLVLEAAEIGHMERFHKAKFALIENLSILDDIQGCRKINSKIKTLIHDFCLSTTTRRYNKSLNQSFGLPVTWGS
jgi:hypothetical protein